MFTIISEHPISHIIYSQHTQGLIVILCKDKDKEEKENYYSCSLMKKNGRESSRRILSITTFQQTKYKPKSGYKKSKAKNLKYDNKI